MKKNYDSLYSLLVVMVIILFVGLLFSPKLAIVFFSSITFGAIFTLWVQK